MLEQKGLAVERQLELGEISRTTRFYRINRRLSEYTGTAFTAILKHQPITDPNEVYEQTKREYGEKLI